MQRLMTAAVVMLALAMPATAQTTAPAPAPTVTGQGEFYAAKPGDYRTSKLIGSAVKNAAGETIGDINEVLLTGDGKVAAVIIGVGGFLGLGQREVAVSFSALRVAQDSSDRTVVMMPTATKESLKAAPEWKWPAKS